MKADAKLSHTVLLVTHLTPFPPARGVELRIWKLLHWLKSEGYQVILVLPCDPMDAHAVAKLQQVVHRVCWSDVSLRTKLGKQFPALRKLVWEPLKPFVRRASNGAVADSSGAKEISVGDSNYKRALCPDSMIDLVTRLARKYQPKAVIAEYIFLAPAFQNLPEGTLKIIDTIDVFSQKPDQVLAYGIDDPQACTRDEERDYLLMADVIVAIQSREERLLKELVPEREVLLVGMDFAAVSDLAPDAATKKVIAVVASDNEMNVHGLKEFLRDCWPQIKAGCPDVSLHVVGKVGDRCRIDDPAVKYTRWVDDLAGVYAAATVVINPAIAGTGLKIKSAETIAHGRPLVAWPNGVEGIDYAGEPPFVVCNSWDAFAVEVTRLLLSSAEAKALAERASTYARDHFAAAATYAPLKRALARRAVAAA